MHDSESALPSIAVLGLGAMGLPMAARLAERFSVSAFDLDPERRDLAAGAGVDTHDSAQAAVVGADVVLLAVRNAEQLDSALFQDAGVASGLRRGSAVVLTSTVGVEAARAAAATLAASGVHLVDAPLSGGPVRARNGDLLIVVGADPVALAVVDPVLASLGSTVTIVSDRAGDGQALKTVNQLLCGVHIAAAAEALALAAALGLDQRVALDALGAGAAGSFMLGNRGPRMVEEFEGGDADVLSRLDIFVKDLGIVGTATRALGLASPVAAAAEQLFILGAAQGLGAADDSAVIRVVAPRHGA